MNSRSIIGRLFGENKENQQPTDSQTGNIELGVENQMSIEGFSALVKSIVFLQKVVQARLDHHFGKTNEFVQPEFSFNNDDSVFARYVIDHKLNVEEFILLLLALAPHTHPDLFSDLIKNHLPKGGDFPEFGGVRGQNYRGIMPTGETVLFVLAGMNLDHRFQLMHWFNSQECLPFATGLVSFDGSKDQEPEMSARLILTPEKVTEFITGNRWKPAYSGQFPAALLTTDMDWDDLILAPATHRELSMIKYWLDHHANLDADPKLGRRTKPGFRALFHGPPGTGKTLTAALLGKLFDLDVYRIDLSMIVSKYIGETEKNLQYIFDKATHKNWILFFDEADALFGKRTNVQSSHDRFANQEVSYLLQKVEDHDGLVILATNFKSNLDQAFMRRFQGVVSFAMPDARERKLLWNNALPIHPALAPDLNIDQLAQQYEISGAAIVNILQMSALKALSESRAITHTDLMEGLHREFAKEGRTL
jgi:ATPase family associated with various cellular activities (AAA)